MFFGQKKRRSLDIEGSLASRRQDDGGEKRRIKFDRLPRRKVKPIWWLVAVFLIVIYLFFFLKEF